MLPYTPLHHLLLETLDGMPLVMTSGNRSDEPIAYDDADAQERLAGIADLFLTHNRPIHVRCDDSVVRGGGRRGSATSSLPRFCALPYPSARGLLCADFGRGRTIEGNVCPGRGKHAFLSHHLGDLDHFAAYQAFVRDISLYEELLAIRPGIIAHDLHPDYSSMRFAREYGEKGTVFAGNQVLIPVQHHHAHIASCLAEHGLSEPVIGVAFDGSGYGTDGAIWGGEFLIADYRHFRRRAHLRYVGMPGGDQAVREPCAWL